MRYVAKKKPISKEQARTKPLFTGAARPKYLIDGINVYDAALGRIRWLFEEFDGKVAVSNSGGKDSTVVVELALQVARERGELPLKVVWLDQECEFQATVDYQRWMRSRPEIDFQWYQIPFRLYNATNHEDPWLNVWGENEEWVRPKEEGTIHVNPFYRADGSQVDRFKEVLEAINKQTGGAILTGMRCEESPSRRIFMVSCPMYKWVTWSSMGAADPNIPRQGRHGTPLYYMFHPIYDWSYRDVWKAIHDNDWTYNAMYDIQFRYGIPIRQMRVSNYHHVQALNSLKYLQEAEPETWEAATRRLAGISTHGHVGGSGDMVKGLPYMFSSWEEYMTYLIENLIAAENRHYYTGLFARYTKAFPDLPREMIAERMVSAVVSNDFIGVSLEAWVHGQRTKIKKAKEIEKMQEEAWS